MEIIKKKEFRDCLDTLQLICKPSKEGLGEDSFYCSVNDNSAIVSVYDGCGGLGAKKYATFNDHTGAYIASRLVSAAVHDWNHDNCQKEWPSAKEFASSINQYIQKAFELCKPYDNSNMRIMGSMVRRFPSTMAIAYAQKRGDMIYIHVLWAGDSRVYLLDENGLAQLTRDDTDVEDALDNLLQDGVMNNVLSSDGNYTINYRTIHLKGPALVFAATDGCFGYLSSPMEFEHVILDSLVNTSTPEGFKRRLRKVLGQYAGDDLALGLMSFYYGSFKNTRKKLSTRLKWLTDTYIDPVENEESDEHIKQLWERYKSGYERFLTEYRERSNE